MLVSGTTRERRSSKGFSVKKFRSKSFQNFSEVKLRHGTSGFIIPSTQWCHRFVVVCLFFFENRWVYLNLGYLKTTTSVHLYATLNWMFCSTRQRLKVKSKCCHSVPPSLDCCRLLEWRGTRKRATVLRSPDEDELPRNSLCRRISSHSLVSEHYDDADVYERFLNV